MSASENDPNVIAFIPARAGSKGLPGKNIINLAGKPLIAHTIEQALASELIDRVIVSTDGEAIAAVARDFGAEVMMRPDALATDTAMPKDALRYHLEGIRPVPDVIVLLQPTSPLRRVEDIDQCVTPVVQHACDSAATFVPSAQNPFQSWRETGDGGVEPVVPGHDPWRPRQALPMTYRLNGAVYAVRTDVFLADSSQSFLPGRNHMVVMPSERSVDIDVKADLDRAEALMRT